jgi:putative SbcD/Mre11-related phosphoesterase
MEMMELTPGIFASTDRCLVTGSTLIIADLHIGYESVLENDGIHLPRMQSRLMSERLTYLIDKFDIEKVVVLGDFKHEFSRNLNQEWQEVQTLLELIKNAAEVVMVRGNHDNYLATILSRMGIPMVDSFKENGVTFVHGHKDIGSRPVIMAHEHPSIRIMDSIGAYVKLPCFLHHEGLGITVIPAFSPLALGTDLSTVTPEDYLSPLLKGKELGGAQIIACSEIGLLPLGKLADLRGLRI